MSAPAPGPNPDLLYCSSLLDNGAACRQLRLTDDPNCFDHRYGSINVSQECEAPDCTVRTCRTYYCPKHLREIDGLEIKASPIAGLGLFATRGFRKGDIVAAYTGDELIGPDVGDDYALEIKSNPRTIISARRTNTGPGRYANSNRKGAVYENTALLYDQERGGYLRATKDILAGAEITTVYGVGHWAAKKVEDRRREAVASAAAASVPARYAFLHVDYSGPGSGMRMRDMSRQLHLMFPWLNQVHPGFDSMLVREWEQIKDLDVGAPWLRTALDAYHAGLVAGLAKRV